MVAYVIFAASAVRGHRALLTVDRLVIDVVDSSSQGHLVSSQRVREWLRHSGIRTVGAPASAVDLNSIEELIARNGFVDKVNAYVTYDGELRIDIRQRRPLLRLLVDGMDSYVTAEGYVFPAPRASSLYVPVVTGSYRPPFTTTCEGMVREYVDAQQHLVGEQIDKLEREKYPFFHRERENNENIRALRRRRVKSGWFESDESVTTRVHALRTEKEVLRRKYRYEERLIGQGIARIGQRQETERLKQKKLEKNYEDFIKLITFVKFIEENDFWRSEVVQIVASTSVSGSLEIELVPRSGNHLIRFGRVEDVEEKFDKLLRFYRNGLGHLGWDLYRTVDLRYEGQVVCKR